MFSNVSVRVNPCRIPTCKMRPQGLTTAMSCAPSSSHSLSSGLRAKNKTRAPAAGTRGVTHCQWRNRQLPLTRLASNIVYFHPMRQKAHTSLRTVCAAKSNLKWTDELLSLIHI
eukprot:9382762-Pyramimonas_sp.AAC.1